MHLQKYLYVLLSTLLLTLIGFFFIYKGLAYSFLLFSLYFILFIFFPAQYFSHKLIPLKLSRLESLVFGYAITEVAIFIFQWGVNLAGFKYGIWVFIIFTVLGFKAWMANNESHQLSREHSSLVLKLSWFYVSFILFFFIFYFLIEIPAFEEGRITGIYHDQLWNIGNTWSVIRANFPTIDSRFSGQILGYHLIQSYFHASIALVSGIPPLLIQNYFFPLVDSFFITFTIGLAAKKFLKWNDKTILLMIFIFLFTKGIGWYYHRHLYSNPLTFFHSLSAFFLFVIVLLNYLESKEAKLFPLLICAFIVMVGSKATLTMIFLPALLLVFIYQVIKKESLEVLKKELYLGLSFIIVCAGLKLMIFLNSRPLMINEGGDYSTAYRLLEQYFPNLSFQIKNFIFLTYITIKGTPEYFSNVQGVLFFSIVTFLLFQKKFKAYINTTSLLLIISVAICIVLENVLRFNGSGGEIYFAWYGKILVIFMFAHIYHYSEKISGMKNKMNFISLSVILAGFSLFLFSTYQTAPWKDWLRNDSNEALGATITFNEFQAMKWLNVHVSDSDIVLSDRRSFPKDKNKPNGRIIERFFAYSALSGKQFLVEGDEFNCCRDLIRSKEIWNKVYQFINSKNIDEKTELLKKFNINYFVQSLRFDKNNFANIPSLELVYSNPDINIYKIK